MKKPLYRVLAGLVQAIEDCRVSGNVKWHDRHACRAITLVKARMPSGSGIDSGTTIDLGACTPEKLVFTTSFHHMDQFGTYDGWTDHTVTVRGSLAWDITITIGGRDRNEIKDHLHEVFNSALRAEIEEYES